MSAEEAAAVHAEWAATATARAAYEAQYGHLGPRAKAYSDIGDQLDMLWHSMDSGEIPKSLAFYNTRAAVKNEFPKPVGES